MHDRARQLSVLHDLLAAARWGNTRMAVVSGPAGFGKSELLHAFAGQAVAAGAAHVSATAFRTEQAVPFGVLAQLFRSADLPYHSAADVVPLVNDNLSAVLSQDGSSPIAGRIFHRVHLALHELVEHASAGGPLVVAIDDIHHADTPSLRVLSAFVRRVRSARLLVVLAAPDGSQLLDLSFQAEIPPAPYSVSVPLEPLTPRGVEALLDQEFGRPAAQRWAADVHAITGGNPQLTRGLVEDNRASADGEHDVVVGNRYGKALLCGLYRSDPVGLAVARGIAVLGDAVTERLLSQLVGLDLGTTRCTLDALDMLGVVDGVRFRHPEGAEAVLRAMTQDERVELHRKAADLLVQHNAPSSVVAEHLLAADHVGRGYALPVLHEAAEHALAGEDLERALDLLRLAARCDPDHPASVVTSAMLARVELHLDTSAAARRVPALMRSIRSGTLYGQHAGQVGVLQIALGDRAGAQETLRTVAASWQEGDADTAAVVDRLRTWLAVVHPASVEVEPADRHAPAVPLTYPGKQAAQLMWEMFTSGPSARTTEAAKRLLQMSKVDTGSAVEVVVALFALAAADDVTAADRWARGFQAEVDANPSRFRRAAFAAGRAELALRRGAVTEAGRQAEAAFSIVPPEHWGVGVGQPLGVLLRVCALTGRHDRAAELLRVPLSAGVFESPLGMGYLRARGRYHLAVNQPELAFEDFTTIGDRVTEWDCDVPALFPWRGDVARAALALGRVEQARALAAAQLELCRPHEHRLLAESLWAMASCSPVHQRRDLLEQAAELLRGSATPIELAGVLSDLAAATRAVGQESKARLLDWHAGTVLRATGAEAVVVDPEAEEPAEDIPSGHPVAELLTNAETRVAALAVRGLSNRQISARLFITVSTVEQHLTRVYRKLNVKSRSDLPADLAVEQLGVRAS
ncbi:AAA family ATPase [Saccharothrix sp. HUAS TT1]|uniref:helix-turn-helix transcriptional regulator n=1 Tax=unclassified Saccharothrix TaxID=2593673 RepID=UPI00345C4EDE